MNTHALRNSLQTVIAISMIIASSQLLLAQNKSTSKPAGPKETHFDTDGRKLIPVGVLAADKMSATSSGNVMTILFEDAKLSLQNENDPLTATWVGTLVIPTRTTPGNRSTSYVQHVRGFVSKTKDSSVSILLTLGGGKTHLISYGYGVTINRNILRQLLSPIQQQTNSYVASIAILVERRNVKSAVQVNIDSLDVDAKARSGAK